MFVSNIILEYLILAMGSPQQWWPTFCQLSRRMSNILIWTINTKGVCWLNNYYLESIECWRYMLIYIYFLESFGCWLWPHLPGVSLHNLRSFMYYIINVYRLSPFPVSQSPFTFVLNAEFAQYLIITTNFEFIVFSCCWKCPQHQLCCQSIRIILHLCASLLINSESSSIAHESSTKVNCHWNWF